MEDKRLELAAAALHEEPFDGFAVADADNFKVDGDVYTCVAYLDDPKYDELIKVQYTVWFEGDKIVKTDYNLL